MSLALNPRPVKLMNHVRVGTGGRVATRRVAQQVPADMLAPAVEAVFRFLAVLQEVVEDACGAHAAGV